ncbi:hypothetical protein Trco_003004 [Trichoderma cornu-damae]|uniref:Uncharacterized protein n=1 Tax=Trichoderma cornu-damae TaxID=654480 RepID=A0A9P8QVT3_9HYPO|nr:hypothetical protein Trco_003004 [Trichoderma cornu-damae]
MAFVFQKGQTNGCKDQVSEVWRPRNVWFSQTPLSRSQSPKPVPKLRLTLAQNVDPTLRTGDAQLLGLESCLVLRSNTQSARESERLRLECSAA